MVRRLDSAAVMHLDKYEADEEGRIPWGVQAGGKMEFSSCNIWALRLDKVVMRLEEFRSGDNWLEIVTYEGSDIDLDHEDGMVQMQI